MHHLLADDTELQLFAPSDKLWKQLRSVLSRMRDTNLLVNLELAYAECQQSRISACHLKRIWAPP